MSGTRFAGAVLLVLLLSPACDRDPTLPDGEVVVQAGRLDGGFVEVPFWMALEGSGTAPADPTRCAPLVTFGLQSSGTATHLGKVTGQHSHCGGDPADPLAFSGGIGVFTAPNGDQLVITYEGTIGLDNHRPGILILNNPVAIAGGTGRFAGATGEAVAKGEIDATKPAGPFWLEIDGTMNLRRP